MNFDHFSFFIHVSLLSVLTMAASKWDYSMFNRHKVMRYSGFKIIIFRLICHRIKTWRLFLYTSLLLMPGSYLVLIFDQLIKYIHFKLLLLFLLLFLFLQSFLSISLYHCLNTLACGGHYTVLVNMLLEWNYFMGDVAERRCFIHDCW